MRKVEGSLMHRPISCVAVHLGWLAVVTATVPLLYRIRSCFLALLRGLMFTSPRGSRYTGRVTKADADRPQRSNRMIEASTGNSLPLDPRILASYRHRMRGELYTPDA